MRHPFLLPPSFSIGELGSLVVGSLLRPASLQMIIDRLSGDGIGDHELVSIIVLWELETTLIHLPLRPPPRFHPSLPRREYPSSRSLASFEE